MKYNPSDFMVDLLQPGRNLLVSSETPLLGLPMTSLVPGNILMGVAEFVLSVLIGVAAIFFAYRSVLKMFHFTDEDLQARRLSAAVIAAGAIIAVAVISRSLLYPVSSMMHLICSEAAGGVGLLTGLAFIAGYLVIAFGTAIGAILLGLRFFDFLTHRIREMDEIKQDNVAVALVFAAVIIALSLYFHNALESLLTVLLPGLQVRIL